MKSFLPPQRSPFVSDTQASLRVVWRQHTLLKAMFICPDSGILGEQRGGVAAVELSQISAVCLALRYTWLSHSWLAWIRLHRPSQSKLAGVSGKCALFHAYKVKHASHFKQCLAFMTETGSH